MPSTIALGFLFAAIGGRATAQGAAAPASTIQMELKYSNDTTLAPFVPIIEFAMAGQKIKAIFDTGSSDIVVPQTGSPICQNQQQQCNAPTSTGFVAGSFDPRSAQGVTPLNVPLNASFVNGAGFQGSYIKTAAALGGVTIPDTQVGLFSEGSLPPDTPLTSIFGVGPVQGETTAPRVYPNLPAHMRESGTIKSNAFSLYTNDFRSGAGSVVFGGVDMAKFSGKLQEAPLQRDNSGALPSFVIQFSSLRMIMGGARANATSISRIRRVPAMQDLTPRNGLGFSLLDSGNPGIGIPATSIQMMAKMLGTTFSQQDGLGLVDCNLANSQSMLAFGFNRDQIRINVPLDTLVVPQRFVNETGCALPIFPSQELPSLGFPFLQSAYVVFDMDQERLLLAQAKPNVTESNIKEFP